MIHAYARGQSVSGLSDHLALEAMDGMLQSDTVVLRVRGARTDYLRGAVFDRYRLGAWSFRRESERRPLTVPSRAWGLSPGEVEIRRVGGPTGWVLLPLESRAILTTDTGPGLGWGAAARVISGAWSVPAYWWSGDAVLPESMAIPVLALVPLVAFVVAVVRADPVAVRAMIVGGAAALTAVPSVALADQPRSYLVAWLPAVVAIVLATSVWVLVKGSHERWVLLLAPALLVPACLVSWRLLTEPPLAFDDATVRAAVAVAERDAAGGVHVSITPDSRAFEVMPGIATELRRRGIGVSGEFPTALPASLAGLIDQQPAGRRGLVVEFFPAPGEPVPAGWRVAAQEDPFTPDQWRELLRYRRMADDPALPERDRALATLGYEQVRAGRTAWRILLQDRA